MKREYVDESMVAIEANLDDFRCLECDLVPMVPFSHRGCKAVYCDSCLGPRVKFRLELTRPKCKCDKIVKRTEYIINQGMLSDIGKLPMICPYPNCDFRPELKAFKAHLEKCPERPNNDADVVVNNNNINGDKMEWEHNNNINGDEMEWE